MEFKKIGVIGAGAMGKGVCQSLAMHGMDALFIDIDAGALHNAKDEIGEALGMHSLLQTESVDVEACMSRIHCATSLNVLEDADFIVENITEKESVKSQLYPALDEICRADVCFAANTSVISITKMASWTKRPQNVLGMHFMNPVPLKPVVEIIKGHCTADTTLHAAQRFLKQMNKKGVIVKDLPGFVANRVLMLTVNEAIWLVHDCVAQADEVDRIFRSCFGHAMGPLETGDLIGLDTILLSLESLYQNYKDPKFRPCPLLCKMVDAGLLGRKTGRGFHEYFAKNAIPTAESACA